MKTNLFAILLFVVCAVTTQTLSQRVWAQSTATSMGMTADQATAVKAIKIANLDKDTYFKSGGFILDRYEERPAYVFTYSDGITRKIYLYKVFTAQDTKELGLLAIYKNEKSGDVKSFVIPGASADRKAWDAYIDDLKYVGEKEPGLMSTLTFVLSREMAGLLAGGSGKSEEGGDKKKDEYNFCFAADAPVTLANGSSKPISTLQAGDVVQGYAAATKTVLPTRVTKLNVHEAGSFTIAGVWLSPAAELTAGTQAQPTAPVLFEATANHPVLTATGRKALGEVTTGELLYRTENGRAEAYRVVRTEAAVRTVDRVYSLATEAGAYVVGGTVVLDK
ncbi:Hint domain-containing protein [Spirosoma sp. 209]|uniref:Hint domain-containing protein n=1 Tax=Spirosoma sp. 209 TaxID=1955701 RepID=UPI00098CFC8F|nr:Hint domain-containing protein [Spirosoma sp. 209]